MHIMYGTWKSKDIKLNTWKYDLIEQLNKIIELNHRIEGNGMYITDIMHVFKANNPPSQFESGQQKKWIILLLETRKTLPIPCPSQT